MEWCSVLYIFLCWQHQEMVKTYQTEWINSMLYKYFITQNQQLCSAQWEEYLVYGTNGRIAAVAMFVALSCQIVSIRNFPRTLNAVAASTIPVIDCHQHMWYPKEWHCPWLDDCGFVRARIRSGLDESGNTPPFVVDRPDLNRKFSMEEYQEVRCRMA